MKKIIAGVDEVGRGSLIGPVYAAAVILNKNINKIRFFLYSFFAITMTVNMFITGGRAGHVMYFVMISILIFQFFNHQKIKSLLAILIIVPFIFMTAYQTSPLFKQRVDTTVTHLLDYEVTKNTSVGHRITFALNSWEIIKENALLGVGTGDFPNEYKKISTMYSPDGPYANNPHNMYILVLVQSGIVGLLSMLSIMYYQIKLSFKGSNRFFRDVGFALPLLFLVIMWSDSYLLGHFTGFLFVFFSSFLYKDFEKS